MRSMPVTSSTPRSSFGSLPELIKENLSSLTDKNFSDCCVLFPRRIIDLQHFFEIFIHLRRNSSNGGINLNGISYYLRIDNVRLLDRFYSWQARTPTETTQPPSGTLYLTPTHLIFVNPIEKRESWIPLGHIGSIERLSMMPSGCPLQIRGKTFFNLVFVIAKDRDCHDVHAALLRLSQPASYEELWCFSYSPPEEDVDRSYGWEMFDLQSEYLRMGLPNKEWTLSRINENYEICDTYPQHLIVPSSAPKKILLGSAGFRSRGRLPVLSYLHHQTKAAICRCSQPLSGFNTRCEEDEEMLNCILRSSPNSKFVYIIDTRPRINAMANRAAGKGYETEANYVGMKVQFFSIENIHVMRGSLQRLMEVCDLKTGSDELNVPSHSIFLSGLQGSGWLKHIKAILDTSVFITEKIEEGNSVLVHCSDGWDRTAQTCSLACLMLDPFYRTLHGFMALIEKDWLAFGHKFSDRAGHLRTFVGSNATTPVSGAVTPTSAMGLAIDNTREQSPVFTQFLDCVWQLMCQHPDSFQFNERFLLTLHDHLYSCQYGTFIGNNQKERRELRLSERTYSLWGYLRSHLHEYLNPLYRPDGSSHNAVLRPDLSPQCLRLWTTMYNRFEDGVHPREPLVDLIRAMQDHSSALEDHAAFLDKRIKELKAVYIQSQAGGDQPLTNGPFHKSSGKMLENPNASDSTSMSIALDWKSTRNVKFCICSTPFSQFSSKYHCWKCGDVVCRRCTEVHIPLPGLHSGKPVPVCQVCHDMIRRATLKQQTANVPTIEVKLQP